MIIKMKICTAGTILVKFVSKNYQRYHFSKYVVCDQKRASGWDMKENLEMPVPEVEEQCPDRNIYIYIYIYMCVCVCVCVYKVIHIYIYIYIYIYYIYYIYYHIIYNKFLLYYYIICYIYINIYCCEM